MTERLINNLQEEIEESRKNITKAIFCYRQMGMLDYDRLVQIIKNNRTAMRECWDGIKKLKE